MKRRFFLKLGVCTSLGLFGGMGLRAEEPTALALKLRQGQVLRYQYEEGLAITPPTKFAGALGSRLEAKVDLLVKVTRVADDGTATLKMSLERLALFKDGSQINDLTVMPKEADEVTVTLKPNGEVRFHKTMYVVMNRSEAIEFRISTGGNPLAAHVQWSGEAEKFHFEADIDEGEGVIKVGVPPTRVLPTPDHGKLAEFKVDITPRKVLELLLLPTMALAEGQTFSTAQRYVAQQKLTNKGQGSEGSNTGSLVEIEFSPCAELSGEGGPGMIPSLSGSMRYLIDSTGKLVVARGQLRNLILVPGIGEQVGESRIELRIKK